MNRKLTTPELETSLGRLPPIMTPDEAAGLLRLKLSTLYRHVSEGRYGSAVRRGKPLRFWLFGLPAMHGQMVWAGGS
jgi:excisionase family DNA binding protein